MSSDKFKVTEEILGIMLVGVTLLLSLSLISSYNNNQVTNSFLANNTADILGGINTMVGWIVPIIVIIFLIIVILYLKYVAELGIK